MAKLEVSGEVDRLTLTQEEFDTLPQQIKDLNPSLEFTGLSLCLPLFFRPVLLTQYSVTKQIESAHSVSRLFALAAQDCREHYPELYAEHVNSLINHADYPTAGDVVLLTGVWPWAGSLAKVGSYGVIEGRVGAQYDAHHITFNFSAHRGWSCCGSPFIDLRSKHFLEAEKEWAEYVSCSGGPATISLPAHLLKPTDRTVDIRFWCWLSLPRANSGVHYSLPVRVWEWDGQGYG